VENGFAGSTLILGKVEVAKDQGRTTNQTFRRPLWAID
jgi:hypothetical protein